MKTTLNKIRECGPCTGGWQDLLEYLNKTKADDEPLSLVTVLDSNGLDDAIWCLRAVEGYDKEIRMYCIWCARQVQHLMKDPRSIKALDVAEAFANGLASLSELRDAKAAACDDTKVAKSNADYAATYAASASYYPAFAAAEAAAYAASYYDDGSATNRYAIRINQEKELRRILENLK